MKNRTNIPVFAALLIAIATTLTLSSLRAFPDDVSDAVAAVIKADEKWEGSDLLVLEEHYDPALERPVCIDSDFELDFAALSSRFDGVNAKPIDGRSCLISCVDGVTNRVSPQGRDADSLIISDVSCSSPSTCDVRVAGRSSGRTYRVEKSTAGWQLVEIFDGWIANVGPGCFDDD